MFDYQAILLNILHWCNDCLAAEPKWCHSLIQYIPHGFVVLCFVVVIQSFIMNSRDVLIHIHQGCFAGTGAIVRFPQCQWSKPDGYGKISQCITTTKHSKAKTVCIFLGIYCMRAFVKTKKLYWNQCSYFIPKSTKNNNISRTTHPISNEMPC